MRGKLTMPGQGMNKRLAARCYVVLWLAGCALFAGCSLLSPQALPAMPLFAPDALGGQWQFSQAVRLQRGLANQAAAQQAVPVSILAAWAVVDGHIQLTGLTPTGQRLMLLGFDGEHFTEQYSALLDAPLPGRDILAQLQLCYWPITAIEQQLQSSPWSIELIDQQRILFWRDTKVLTIERANAGTSFGTSTEIISSTIPIKDEQIVINNFGQQYHLMITTLHVEALP